MDKATQARKKAAVMARRDELAAYGARKRIAAELGISPKTLGRYLSEPAEPPEPPKPPAQYEPPEPPKPSEPPAPPEPAALFKLIEPVTLNEPIVLVEPSAPPAPAEPPKPSPYREWPESMKPLRPPTQEEFEAILLGIGPAPKTDKPDR